MATSRFRVVSSARLHLTHTSFTELRGDLVVGDGLAYQLRLQTEGESIYRILEPWVWKGNLTRMIYILIRKIDGSILSYHTEVQLLPRRHQPLQFFDPVENDGDLIRWWSGLYLHHRQEPSVRRDVVASSYHGLTGPVVHQQGGVPND